MNIPINNNSNQDSFANLSYTDGWYLTGVTQDKTLSQIESLVTNQGKILQYIWIYRTINNTPRWYLYSSHNLNTTWEYRLYPEDIITQDEAFWIFTQ